MYTYFTALLQGLNALNTIAKQQNRNKQTQSALIVRTTVHLLIGSWLLFSSTPQTLPSPHLSHLLSLTEVLSPYRSLRGIAPSTHWGQILWRTRHHLENFRKCSYVWKLSLNSQESNSTFARSQTMWSLSFSKSLHFLRLIPHIYMYGNTIFVLTLSFLFHLSIT